MVHDTFCRCVTVVATEPSLGSPIDISSLSSFTTIRTYVENRESTGADVGQSGWSLGGFRLCRAVRFLSTLVGVHLDEVVQRAFLR